MVFYTTTTFRKSIEGLTKKARDGYVSVIKDVCEACMLHQTDISKGLEELNMNASLPGDK